MKYSLPMRVIAAALAVAGAQPAWPRPVLPLPTNFAGRILATHNAERVRLGLLPFRWNATLAARAQLWAEQLSSINKLEHSSRAVRGDTGETLWMGTEGAFEPEDMIDAFVGERSRFHPGTFPDVSITGQWEDVAHYSQIVWPTTTDVGCGLAMNDDNEFLVCRYGPAGNIVGAKVP